MSSYSSVRYILINNVLSITESLVMSIEFLPVGDHC